MARTKAAKKKPASKANTSIKKDVEELQLRKKQLFQKLDQYKETFDIKVEAIFAKLLVNIPAHIKNSRFSDLKKNGVHLHNTTVSYNYSSVDNVLHNHTNTAKKRKKALRSSSCHEDDGYLTAEMSDASSGGRQSRSRKPAPPKSTRVSRSLSRVQVSKPAPLSMKTPANRNPPPNSYGMVTPKVKPNTPQVLLRRPKQGEMALSLQGSPLFTGSVVSESVANINIPLNDGRMFTLQPERGLRMSQVPDLDPETRRQLQTLRDNLAKVCGQR
ncbi:unnamed protein product [Brassicogethes aeneus]|uniref:Borealin C-terminal domain-containing protein n=1 Tax=Brassicogethes aeneus TaxID=1431903 RepID=A0A9P0B0H5_BRAAE|nr:unnamed protein product [Brassicogethes aeneus]